MTDTVTAEHETALIEPLVTADRCDRCFAQAIVRFAKDGMLLDFCLHHATENRVLLGVSGFVEIENIEHILTKRSTEDHA